jgi:RNA polymerase sigma-70 factor (ECF subfamily)
MNPRNPEHNATQTDLDSVEAKAALFRQWQMPVYRYLRGMLGNHADADDAAQEVWLQVMRFLHQLERQEAFAGWLFRIAHRKALDVLRKRARERSWMQSWDASETQGPQPIAEAWMDIDALERAFFIAVERLPVRQKQVFLLRYFEGLAYEEIAQITGVGLSSLKTSHHLAVAKVQRMLRSWADPHHPSFFSPHPDR